MNNEILRNYHLSDATMLSFAKAAAGYLGEDLIDFTSFDSTINDEYLTKLQALVAQAAEGVSDNVIIDRQVQLSDDVNKKLKDCVEIVRSVNYFVKKAFESKAVQNEFGVNIFSNVKSSKDKMILFLRDYDKVANIYKDKLIEAGCQADLIDSIAPAYKTLDEASQKSELYKGNRPVITQERIEKNNALWAKVQGVVNAAKVIYYDNVPKLKRYMTPKSGSRNQSIKVGAGATVTGINNGFDEEAIIEIKNTGKSNLTFYVADNTEAEIPDNALIVNAHESTTVKAESISNGTYGVLLASNQTSAESGFVAQLLE